MTVSLNANRRHLNRTALIIIAVISIRALFDIVYRFPGIFPKCCAFFFFHLISLIPNLLARVSTQLYVMIQMYIARIHVHRERNESTKLVIGDLILLLQRTPFHFVQSIPKKMQRKLPTISSCSTFTLNIIDIVVDEREEKNKFSTLFTGEVLKLE